MKLFHIKMLFIFIIIFTPLFFLVDRAPSSNLSESEIKKSQIEQIETDLLREKEQLQKFDFKERSLLDQLSDIEQDITEKRSLLKELGERIDLSRRELKERQERLNQLESSLTEIEDLLGKRLVAFYKYAKGSYFKILATTSGLVQLDQRMKYLKIILDEDRKVMKYLAEESENYHQEVLLIEEKLAAIASLEEEENDRLLSLKQDLEQKVIFLANIHKEKEFYETAVRELQAAAQNLKETLLNLENDQQKKIALPTDFAELKGKLQLPLSGKILKENGTLGGKDFNIYKGIYIEGPFGADVKAVFPGRVDFSGQLKGYGEVIVINHGDRYFTISAYLLHREKLEGEIVAEGDVIGQVGETGLLTGPALYFEIRRGETNLNPLTWLKLN